MGETILYIVLEQLKKDGLIRDWREQPRLSSGQLPDAVLELLCGRDLVVDSKASRAAKFKVTDTFVRNYRNMMIKLKKRNYPANVPNSLDYVVVFNPFHCDLRHLSTLDDFARKNGMKLVSPKTLPSLIHSINNEHKLK